MLAKGSTREELRADMTPARFDLLCALALHPFQSALSECLGVSREAVSVMVRRLVSLGWLRRQRAPDKRTFIVSLTELGTELFDLARAIVEGAKSYRSHFDAFFTGSRDALRSVFTSIRGLARSFADRSTLHNTIPPAPVSSRHVLQVAPN
jgi:DNA-binding MarR family transcriptional regulator